MKIAKIILGLYLVVLGPPMYLKLVPPSGGEPLYGAWFIVVVWGAVGFVISLMSILGFALAILRRSATWKVWGINAFLGLGTLAWMYVVVFIAEHF